MTFLSLFSFYFFINFEISLFSKLEWQLITSFLIYYLFLSLQTLSPISSQTLSPLSSQTPLPFFLLILLFPVFPNLLSSLNNKKIQLCRDHLRIIYFHVFYSISILFFSIVFFYFQTIKASFCVLYYTFHLPWFF